MDFNHSKHKKHERRDDNHDKSSFQVILPLANLNISLKLLNNITLGHIISKAIPTMNVHLN